MARKQLKKPPLVEVILEIRWNLEKGEYGNLCDPYSTVLPGRIYDKLCKDYPYIEKLPTSNIPDEMSPYFVKQRFRRKKNDWPLVQIGPGILTCNHTQKYTTFEDFRPLAVAAINTLFEVYPKPLSINNLVLKYIDAIEFDFAKDNIFQFLKEKMNIQVGLPDKLFDQTGVNKKPAGFNWRSTYHCKNPLGLATIGFATGVKSEKFALVWEHIVESNQEHLRNLKLPEGFESWLLNSHRITDEWFFSLIEGELEGVFEND